MFETNPIRPPDRQAGSWLELIVQNEPNFRAHGWGERRGVNAQNEPNLAPVSRDGHIRADLGPRPGSMVQNKPNFPAGAGLGDEGVLYKQTQFFDFGLRIVRNEPNVRQDKLGKEDVHEYFVNGNLE